MHAIHATYIYMYYIWAYDRIDLSYFFEVGKYIRRGLMKVSLLLGFSS